MIMFIQLTTTTGHSLWVDIKRIVAMELNLGVSTTVTLEYGITFTVRDTPADIQEKISEAWVR